MERYDTKTAARGTQLLSHPMYNKGSAFTREERLLFGLDGLLPAAVNTIEQQAERVWENLARKSDPLERYIGLASLEDRNEHLFHHVLREHLEEFLPIVYTPTVGRACQEFSHIFRRARGLWITPEHRGRIFEVLGNAPFEDVRLIVVTDNERILGLGDQGAGGMGIPIGKVAVYTAAAGIHPSHTLPVSLDVGTDNEKLLADDLYLGWRHRRLRGGEYDLIVGEFVEAVRRRFPRALLQWEDFKKQNAFNLLDRYRTTLPSFNDDIQGTGACALAGILAAARVTGISIQEQRVVIVGAGAAGIGMARQIRAAQERAGLTGADLTRALALVELGGLLALDGQPLDEYQVPFAWPASLVSACRLAPRHDLEAVVRALRPTVLIGACGQPGAFTKGTIQAMATHVERPVIFPLSNPTSQSEAVPSDLIEWTDGRALVAAGSPFEPVRHAARTLRVAQCNNAFIFPGIGLGALVAGAREVSDGMFAAAAECLAGLTSEHDLAAGALYPPIRDLRRVATRIAEAVVHEARRSGAGSPPAEEATEAAVAAAQWEPRYPVLEPA
jgi:malate dehydrogenase (oxaloacetate-decarboxylating)